MRANAASSALPALCVGLLSVALGLGTRVVARAAPPESPLDSAQRLEGAGAALPFDSANLVEATQAIRAAPFAPSPELYLGQLVRLAAGRDPTRAPCAALAVRRITARLTPGAIDAHETDRAALDGVARALRVVVADTSARADIRRLASLSASELEALTR